MLEREKKELAAINQAIKAHSNTISNGTEALFSSDGSKPTATSKQFISSSKKQLRPTSSSSTSHSSATLKGIRPECEAVMRAIFCKLDR
jgi:hypothetical protein